MGTLLFNVATARFDEIVKPGLLCAFDFDGTIAPIVRDPDSVSVPTPISRRLAALRRYAQVAIITGRSLEDVSRHIDFNPHHIVGNHGLEGLPDMPSVQEACVPVCVRWEADLKKAMAGAGESDPGIRVENKGHSLSVHYRLAHDREKAREKLHRLITELVPAPRVIGGKCVFNLLPVTDMDKGTALVRLMEHCQSKSALYVGDDLTDEDIFELRLPNLMTVRIGRNEESAADFYIHHRLDMAHLLDEVIKRLEIGELRSA